MQLPAYHEDISTFRKNAMPDRAYYIPYASAKDAMEKPREESSRLQSLGGVWSFSYYPNHREVPECFKDEGYDRSAMDSIPVPSCWQMHGYDRHMYSNTNFPFPYDPPYVPSENPCGAYVTDFMIDESADGMRRHLIFEGVDSCYYFWVNGAFGGYAQVSHSASEFDITDLTRPGSNRLAVLVLKWCDGSYLEDQDKFRMSGIFRDVYLLHRPTARVQNFRVTTPIAQDYKAASVELTVQTEGSPDVTATLLCPGGKEIGRAKVQGGKASFPLENPALWTAETPSLYTLVLETKDEAIARKVGIRDICVKDAVVYLNGQNIKLKGVNRHDSNPLRGFAVTRDDMLRDIRLMKQHNVNALRTSHYPNSPLMIELCEQVGLYVIDESDIEAHGCNDLYGSQGDMEGLLADDVRWADAFLDRVRRNVERDINSPCVIIWSLGNESGYGGNLEKAGYWVKQFDPTRLLHYERTRLPIYDPDRYTQEPTDPDPRRRARAMFRVGLPFGDYQPYPREGGKYDEKPLDMVSRMYAPPFWVDEYMQDAEKPLIQCEFTHAMGNGPGDLEENYQQMYKYDKYVGGFVWEWCDHSVYMGKTEDGRDKYYYGGDFGEFPSDANFCMDGLVYPDRTPHTGLLELKNVARPVRLVGQDMKNGKFSFRNTLDFLNAKDVLEIRWEIKTDGRLVASGSLGSPDIAPHATAKLSLGAPIPPDPRTYILFSYVQTCDMPFTQPGHHLGHDQAAVPAQSAPAPKASGAAPRLVQAPYAFEIQGDRFRYTFDRVAGTFTSMVYDNRSLISRPMEYNIWRAPTDNDRNIRNLWEEAGYRRVLVRVYESAARAVSGEVVITAKLALTAPVTQRILTMDATYSVDGAGKITVSLKGEKTPIMPFLPRFGLRLFLPKETKNVEYFGLGPVESYWDKRQYAWMDRFATTVPAMHENYLKPQENGAHDDCEEMQILCAGGSGLRVDQLERPFSFNASHYAQEELTDKMHSFEIEESPYTILCVDAKQSGIGSNSCGPMLNEAYRLVDDLFLSVAITPVVPK